MKDILQLQCLYHENATHWQQNISEFVSNDVKPIIAQAYDEAYFPEAFINKLANLNLLGMTLPTEYGGQAADYLSYGVACQELEKGDSSLRTFVSVQSSLCMYPIFQYGSEKQRKQYLSKLAKAELIGCFALTEPNSGSDPANMQTVAKPVDGGWQLSGHKQWITNAPIADIGIIWANVPDQGIRAFILDLEQGAIERITTKRKLSLRASSTGELVFNNIFVPQDNLLPGTEKGLSAALACLNQARYGIAWGVMGAAQACLEKALNYTQHRQQFNQPLARFQLVQKDLVDCYTEITKAQLLNYRISELMETGQAPPALISMTKLNSCRQALAIARKTRALLGANGISIDNEIIRHMTNLETVVTYEGTENIHTLILGKYLTGINAFS